MTPVRRLQETRGLGAPARGGGPTCHGDQSFLPDPQGDPDSFVGSDPGLVEGDDPQVRRLFSKEELGFLILHVLKELELPTPHQEADTSTGDVAMAGLKAPPQTFPFHHKVLQLVSKEWEVPEASLRVSRAMEKLYPLPADSLDLLKTPLVDSAVTAVVKHTTIPVTGGIALKDLQDRKLEVLLKRIFDVAALGVRAAACSSLVQRANLRWVQQLLTSQELPPGEAEQANCVEAAVAYTADALYDLLRTSARVMSSAVSHQRRHLDLARSVSDDIEEQRALATIGRTYLYMHESSQADGTLEQAESAFLKSLAIVDDKLEGKVSSRELSEMRARLFLNLGFLSDSKKDPAKCSYYIRKSIFIAEKTHLYEDLYRANFNLGCIHLRQGEPSRAIRCLEAAKESARKMKEKLMESECFAVIGQVLLSLGDLVAAKRSLKKAHLLGSQRTEERQVVRRNLKYAIKGCSLEEALVELADGDLQKTVTLSEQLGDLLCKVSCYGKALEAYKMQLRSAEALRRPEPELAVIHVSLAATYGDLKEHQKAVSHYQAELELRRGNPTEECKTWLNIAHAKEEDRQSCEELESCLTSALQCANRAAKPILQRQVLEQLHVLQLKFGSLEAQGTQARLQELCRQQGWDLDGGIRESSEEEELENSEPLEESDLELSESDEEEDLEGYEKTVSGRRKINRWNRRNEKGETPLHRACIDGNLKQIQYLVEKGHPVNPRDYCGWTPLHEVCNHGHLEIVQYLLEHGANINDPGGPLCEGITPLHDALSCGHFEVAQLLIKRGASVTQKSAKGLTPLGTLQEWTHMYRKHLDQEARQKRQDTENLLKEAVSGRAFSSLQPAEDFHDSELFDAESSQTLTQCSSRPGPLNFQALEQDSRRPQHNSGAPFITPTGSSRVPGSKAGGCHLKPSSTEDNMELLDGINLLACSTQVPVSHRWRTWDADKANSSEEEQDQSMVPLRPVKKRVLGQRSPMDIEHTDNERRQTSIVERRHLDASTEDSSLGPLDEVKDMDIDFPNTGRSMYQQAMRDLGSAKSRILSQTLTDVSSGLLAPRDRDALIPPDQYLTDDWLEDDLGKSHPRKRSRKDPLGRTEEDMGSTGTDSDDSDAFLNPQRMNPPCPTRQTISHGKKRSRQTKMTQIVDRAVVGRTKSGLQGVDGSLANTSIPRVTSAGSGGRESNMDCSAGSVPGVTPLLPVTAVGPAVTPTIRVRVRVQDNVFLIPIPHSGSETRPVSWLAEQASQRYYQTCGLLPRLTLKKEGALLAPQDLILHVLQSNEEVLAEVHSWDLPPLAERYRKACQSLAVAEHRLVLKALEQQESNSSFTLLNFALRQKNLTPLLRALKLQTSIRHLELSGNCIDDTMAEELLATVATMPNLTLLNLSSNQITHEGLKKFCPAADISSESTFKNLEELNLSINPLGDACSQFLASLIRSCPVLSTLRLQACGLTAKFLQHYRLLLANAFKGAVHLKTLALSYNALGSTGVELILKSLPHDSISQLEIGSVTTSNKDGPLMEHVVRYLSQEGCALKHLSLSGNHLTDEAIRDLARCLPLCPLLVSLDMSGNPGIGADSLEALLAALRERKSGLKYLSLAGCSVHGPLCGLTLDRIASDLQELQLCSRRLSKMDQEQLVAVWQSTTGIASGVVARQQKLFCKSL
ncbi:tonsoku-like protein [Rhinatrema bivittatum]|uniref:tonsoku-like protein n=1 Tax=Rhinatrema bivittatum TaxID=194408 RepID=UPI00112709F1|nr:tonsoku-like protein [Rhinatrema bivittatum]